MPPQLPDKLIPSLVKYYYSWKKTRSRTSVMDRQARRLLGRRDRDDRYGTPQTPPRTPPKPPAHPWPRSNDETDEHRPSPDGDAEPADPKKEVWGAWGGHRVKFGGVVLKGGVTSEGRGENKGETP